MFEVETLKFATLATVSRCGMVWFSEDVLTSEMIYQHYLMRLMQDDYDANGEDPEPSKKQTEGMNQPPNQPEFVDPSKSVNRKIRKQCVDSMRSMFDDSETSCFMTTTLDYASTLTHVMDFTRMTVLESFFALMRRGITNVIDYNENHSDFPLEQA